MRVPPDQRVGFRRGRRVKFVHVLCACAFLTGCWQPAAAPDKQAPNAAAGPSNPDPRYKGKTRPEWEAALQDSDANRRCAAVKALASVGPDVDWIAPDLVRALDDGSDAVRSAAAVALVSFGEAAVPALKQKVRDRRPAHDPKAPNPQSPLDLDLGLLDMLVYIDPWFAGGLLPAAIASTKDDEPDFRVVAIKALETIRKGNPKQEPSIVAALEKAKMDRNDSVRDAAVEALARLQANK